LLTASSATFQYLITGLLRSCGLLSLMMSVFPLSLLTGSLLLDYALFYSLLGLVTTAIGQLLLDKIIKKYERSSIIVFSVALILFLATVLLALTGIVGLIDDFRNGHGMGFSSVC
jgi:hypothetical protein